MRNFVSDVGTALREPTRIVLWVSASLVAGLTGPFGTYEFVTLPDRLLVFALISAGCIVALVTLRLAVRRSFPRLGYPSQGIVVALATAAFTAEPVTLGLRSVMPSEMYEATPVLVVFAMVFFPALVADLIRHQVVTSLARKLQAAAGFRPRLCARLPEAAGTEVLALSACDHQVKVRTATGIYELRMRLADAIAEMEGVDGFCTHRSHWVTAAAVTGSGRDNGRPVLCLRDGGQVPVSRKYRPAVEARGLL